MTKDPTGEKPGSFHDTTVGKLLSDGHDAVSYGADKLIDNTVGGVSGEFMKAGAQITIRGVEGAWKGAGAAASNLMEGDVVGAATDGYKYATGGLAEGVGNGVGKLGAKVGLVDDANSLGKSLRGMTEDSVDKVVSGEAFGIKDEGPAKSGEMVKSSPTPQPEGGKAKGKDTTPGLA